MIICFSLCSCGQYDGRLSSVQSSFNNNKESFTKLNEYLLDCYSSVDTNELIFAFTFSDETGQVSEIYSGYSHEYVYLDEDTIEHFDNARKAFAYDFSIIYITDTRISYGGDGNEMFVYSLDGKKPKYFWSDEKKHHFSTYSLGDNWYYLFLRQR